MIDQNQKLIYVFLSVLISLGLHYSLWRVASVVDVRSMDQTNPQEHRKLEVNTIDLDDSVDLTPPEPLKTRPPAPKSPENMLQSMFDDKGLAAAPIPRLKPVIEGLGRNLIEKPRDQAAEPNQPLSAPPPEIIAVDSADAAPMKPGERPLISTEGRVRLKPGISPSITSVTPNDNPGFADEQMGLGMRMKPPRSGRNAGKQRTEMANLPKSDPVQRATPRDAPVIPVDAPTATTVLDAAFDVSLQLFDDPDGGDDYFQLEITAGASSDQIPSVPKDILFLVDASSSITYAKFRQFAHGLKLSLDFLSKEDRFNIVAFRDRPIPLFSTFVKPDELTLLDAHRFIDDLSPDGKTDVYAGLAPYVARVRKTPVRPFIIFLISDGRTTTGDKLEDRELIRRIIRENVANVSIFSFSVGTETNLFLMDFLSFENRGLSLNVTRVEKSYLRLVNYVGNLSDIISADVTFKITGVDESQIFPKKLPHLFRGHPLRVYGRVRSGTEEVGIQVKGRNSSGGVDELVTRITTAQATRAGRDLEYNWAAQKIYHLLGENILDRSETHRPDIIRLAQQYNILVPY